jgi:hypothetical protein
MDERKSGNSKLIAGSGKISSEITFNAGTFSVMFRKAAIASIGDFGEVQIGRDGEMVHLTYAQALSLAHEIIRRCS